jgi:hypothetical protein
MFSVVPAGTFSLCAIEPSHEWLGYFQENREERSMNRAGRAAARP